MKPLLLIFLFLSCSAVQTPDCITTCGAYVFGTSDCAGLNAVEALTLKAFEDIYPRLCDRYGTVSIEIGRTKDGTFYYGKQRVAGLTWCDASHVQLGSDDWVNGAYAHEMAHIAQCPSQEYGHQSWEALGIWRKLASIKEMANQPSQVSADR